MNDGSASNRTHLSYKDAGVDIEAGNALVEQIKDVSASTRRPEVLSGLGGFGGLCRLPDGYREPVLVSATDGVGTKLRLAIDSGRHDSVGIDLVAMCVNDLIVCGAEPLFFLDYYACGGLDVAVARQVIEGIGEGCRQAGCTLIGGETAEMPGMYGGGDYDLAGFAVGVVERARIIDPQRVKAGDRLIGLRSSGAHSNGYSLIRKVLDQGHHDPEAPFEQDSLIDALLQPTEIYVQAVRELATQVDLHGLAHITGGGLPENLPRILPDGTRAVIDTAAWQWPSLFSWLQREGNIDTREMYRTFNCGIGMVVCVAAEDSEGALALLDSHNRGAVELGRIESADTDKPWVELRQETSS